MEQETIPYTFQDVKFYGHLAFDAEIETSGRRPAILIAHAWRGQDHFVHEKAEELAKLGYVAMAADVYGEAKQVDTNEEASKLMMPLFFDRTLLQGRINAALQVLQKHPLVDTNKIGAIGFCFGGLTVIELLRSGADVKGVVSFHGLLGDQLGETKAKRAAPKPIKGSLLMLHGHDDPMVSQEDIVGIENELTAAKVDWQLNIYSQTTHAFTNPEANDPKSGMVYNPRTASRAWLAMTNFFNELFK